MYENGLVIGNKGGELLNEFEDVFVDIIVVWNCDRIIGI